MKKRFVSAALAAVMALSMTACGSSNSAAETTAADTEAAESQAEETTAEEAKTTDGGTLIVGFDQDFPCLLYTSASPSTFPMLSLITRSA